MPSPNLILKFPRKRRSRLCKSCSACPAADLLECNEQFHQLLTEGIPIECTKDGERIGEHLYLIDFKNPLQNDLALCQQYRFIEANHTKRLDLLLFVNGLPLVVFELKNPTSSPSTLDSAYQQLQNYKAAIPVLFQYNALLIISDGLNARAGSLSAPNSRLMAWKCIDGQKPASDTAQLATLIQGMLQPTVLLDLIYYFTLFDPKRTSFLFNNPFQPPQPLSRSIYL